MCGIAGAIGYIDDRVIDGVREASRAQAHRGPDACGEWTGGGLPDAGVAFCHRRLAILDLRVESNQPMHDQRTGITLVYNGEVYNFLELRAQLERQGVSFRTDCDTEVILQAYIAWGPDFVVRLRGMFAFALYDPRIGSVFLVRDRLGIKPLCVAELQRDAGKTVLFASEVRALLATGLIDRRADPAGIASFLWNGFVSGPGTVIQGVRRIDPGTWLEVDVATHEVRTHRYWRLPSCEIDHSLGIEQLRAELSEATRLHLVSDVPLGVFLSGGVDSSAVSALAAESAGSGLRTFNISFDDPNYDESTYARQVANLLGTEHTELRLTADLFREHLDDALNCIDQPTFDAINTYFVSRAVREAGMTVALAGTGGDELFGGYATFADLPRMRRGARIASWMPRTFRHIAGKAATRLAYGAPGEVGPQVRWAKLEQMLAHPDWLELYQLSYALFVPEFLHELRGKRGSDAMYFGVPAERAKELSQWSHGAPGLHAISMLELACFIGDRLLPDTDVASMAVSLEVRVPLLDHHIVETVSRVDPLRRFMPLRKKKLLRDIALAKLPPALFNRPKAGFELPLERWCRSDLRSRVAAVLCDGDMCRAAGLNAGAVERLWRAFEQGAPGLYWSRVWAIFVLLDWFARHQVSI